MNSSPFTLLSSTKNTSKDFSTTEDVVLLKSLRARNGYTEHTEKNKTKAGVSSVYSVVSVFFRMGSGIGADLVIKGHPLADHGPKFLFFIMQV